MTLRAIRILKEADVVLAEDTRTTGILLKHFDIHNHLMSHHKFNEHGTSAAVVERLKAGQTVALVSDAGTPGISDPGFFLVRGCQGRYNCTDVARGYGLYPGNSQLWPPVRQVLRRGVPATEEGT